MSPKETIEDAESIGAVVAVFNSTEDVSRVAASVRNPDIKLQRVSRSDPTSTDELPTLIYDDIEEVSPNSIAVGMLKGGAIGVGSGLLLLGVPILNVAAPFAAGIAGAFIGSVAGVDEAKRGIELPNQDDYRQMLADGKSFIVISGDEAARIRYANQMRSLGAVETYQHPPVLQAVRKIAKE